MIQHAHQDPSAPADVTAERYTNGRGKHISEATERSSNDSQATGKKIAKPGIQCRPQERANGVICKECDSAGAFDSSQRRSDTIQSRDELHDHQGAQAPLPEDFVRSLGAIAWVTAEDAEYPHDMAAPMAASFEPDKITGETSQDAYAQHDAHGQLATSGEGPGCQ